MSLFIEGVDIHRERSMTDQEKEIAELRRTLEDLQVRGAELQAKGEELQARADRLEKRLKEALGSLLYVLNQYSLCEICEYVDDECTPESGACVPKWKGA